MYPNLYYIFKDWFGISWEPLSVLNVFGLMVAIAFVAAAIVLTSEFKRKEKQLLLLPREETIIVGMPASFTDLLLNFVAGFIFGYKLGGVILNKPATLTAQEYLFSKEGNLLIGIILGLALAGQKWWSSNKNKQKEPEHRVVRIWPHDRVGDIIILGLVFGIIGSKLFDAFEHLDALAADPLGVLLSPGGLTFYGGLIVAAIAISWYAYRKGIKLLHLVDVCAPALMIAYAIGRIGCQVAGDGDWGVYNSAYISDASGKVVAAKPGEFEKALQQYSTYHLQQKINDSGNVFTYIPNARSFPTLAQVPHINLKAPSFLPVWMVAYSYPRNVNKDGKLIPGCNEEHCRALPQPVFPTPFYETVICTLLFLMMWAYRKRIKIPGVMFGIYLIMNGLERFIVEKIRVNDVYEIAGFHPSQAQVIAVCLMISGIALIIWVMNRNKLTQ